MRDRFRNYAPVLARVSSVVLMVCILTGSVAPSAMAAPAAENAPRRALFVTVLQDPSVLASRAEMTTLIAFAREAHIDILFVQIYRANQSWFPSRHADQRPYAEALRSVGTDPFRLLIDEAHAAGIEVHAWLNMLSLGVNADAPLLRKYGPDILTKNRGEKKRIEDYKIDDQYFLEPGDTRVRKELAAMVGEIVRAYPALDGIQFDYLRYPDKDPAYGYAPVNMRRFKRATGARLIGEESRLWKDWKRSQVTSCLETLVKAARGAHPDIAVSATGCMPYVRAYHEAFQDWPGWIARGLVDFVTVMNYAPDADEFARWNTTARQKAGDLRKVFIGIGAYKLGDAPTVFAREWDLAGRTGCGGRAIFHYESLAENEALGAVLTAAEGRSRPSQ